LPGVRRHGPVQQCEAGPGRELGPRRDAADAAAEVLRVLQADPVGGPAGHHDQVTVAADLVLAVAEAVALGDLLDVLDRAAGHQGLAVAEPELRADARPDRGAGVAL